MQQKRYEAHGPGGTMLNPAVEQIEEQALRSWHAAAARSVGADFGWRLQRVGDALCSVTSTEPSTLLNRVLGLGSRGEPSIAQLQKIRGIYATTGVSRFFLHLHPELRSPDVLSRLHDARYCRYRGWMKFTRDREPVGAALTDLSVRRIGAAEATAFAAIAAPAFDLKPASRVALAALVHGSGWHLYMSFDGDRPAGTGAIYVAGDIAYLDWAATHPDYRRRGSQTALLNARLRHALDAGCRTVVVMTGEAVPGDPQHSYRNILRAGFSEWYCRDNWVPAD